MGVLKTKVFVSCGQREDEKAIGREVCELLAARGFNVYLAIDVQTIHEINERIIRELKNSDCFLFVNFRREEVHGGCRGSLFSNQEFAIAFALRFERLLVVNQEGIVPEGMLRYVGVNTETFRDVGDCCAVVGRALDRARWTPEYTRRLWADGLRISSLMQPIICGPMVGQFLYADLHNGRPDIAALECTAKLFSFGKVGTPLEASPIRSPLKATGRSGFSHTIFPNSYEAFDLLFVGTVRGLGNRRCVCLNSALDVTPLRDLPITAGIWLLRYQFYAIDFPVLTVDIELSLDERPLQPRNARIVTQEALS